MSKDIKSLLQDAKDTAKSGDLSSITVALKAIKQALVMLLLSDELDELKSAKSEIEVDIEVGKDDDIKINESEAVDNLAEIATTKSERGEERLFLLHRPTEDYEYDESASDGDFETSEDTEWIPDYMTGEGHQKGDNPLVSCWVPESAITVPNPHPNTGTWNDLGANPHAERYRVIVKPGKYKLYSELKQ